MRQVHGMNTLNYRFTRALPQGRSLLCCAVAAGAPPSKPKGSGLELHDLGQDLISVLSVEMGFFHGVTRKAFGDPHIGGCEQSYRFIGGKTKGCPQCSTSHPGPGGSALWLQKPSLWGLRRTRSSPSPGGPGSRDVEFSGSLSPSTPLPGLHGAGTRRGIALQPTRCLWGRGAQTDEPQAFVTLSLYFLGFGRDHTFFQTNQSSDSSWACARPSPNPIPFLALGGFLILPYPILSRVRLLRLWRHLGVYCVCLSRGISPSLDLPPPGNLGEHGLAPC